MNSISMQERDKGGELQPIIIRGKTKVISCDLASTTQDYEVLTKIKK